MPKLTTAQRMQLTKAWLHSDKKLKLQEYIKKVCEVKGIEYTEGATPDRTIKK